MEKEKKEKFSNFNNINDILEFILKYKNSFEKRKYFLIDKDYKLIKREPSFILELANIYFDKNTDNYTNNKKIEDIIIKEFENTFIDKNKKIERMSKVEILKLEDSFRRTLINQEKIHSIKLGNELLHRDKDKFFCILYNISLISEDSNRLIKTYFTEKIIDKIYNKEKNSFNKNREVVDEIVKNIINYFIKSENHFLDINNKNNIEYFIKNKVDVLYIKIYEKIYEELLKKYNIKIDRIIFEKNSEEEYNKLSKSKKILYDNI